MARGIQHSAQTSQATLRNLRAGGRRALSVREAYDVGRSLIEVHRAGEDGGPSLRELSAALGDGVTLAAIFRYLAVYRVCQALGGVPSSPNVRVSHLSLLGGLTRTQQRRLVAMVAQQKLSVAELENQLAAIRARSKAPRRGRPTGRRFERALTKLPRFQAELCADLPRARELDKRAVQRLLRVVSEFRRRLDEVERSLVRVARSPSRRRAKP